MLDSDTLNVYWAPFSYDTSSIVTRSQLYAEPIPLSEELRDKKSTHAGNRSIFACPASNDLIKNTFVFKNNFESIIDLPMDFLQSTAYDDENLNMFFPFEDQTIIGISKPRKSSFTGYVNLGYNLSWGFFADEPVNVRITAPYMPTCSPGEGVILAAGSFDIGQWYRPFNLDYHVPFSTTTLSFKEHDALFYLEVQTNKKVKMNRFMQTPSLVSLSQEAVSSPNHYGWFKPLSRRYEMAKKAGVPKQVLSEIKKNLVE